MVVSITEASHIHNVSRQAIYFAIKEGKLRAIKGSTTWKISTEDLKEYKENKYSRKKSVIDGNLLFNDKEGLYSINDVAKILQVPVQKIYYAIRLGHLKHHRIRMAYVIKEEDMREYEKTHLKRKKIKII